MAQISKKKKLAAIAAAFVVVSGGVAFAYWTTTGSGSGTAATGDGAESVLVNQTALVDPLAPDVAAQTLSGTFDNPNPGSVYIATVTVSIGSVTQAIGAAAGTCDATDYTLTGATMTVAQNVPAGTAVGTWGGATIAFNNKATNQDACKGATVNLAYTAA